MSSPDTWMPLYVGRYLADTGHLTVAEHGAYLLLLMQYWCRGPLPDDDEELAIMSKTDSKAWKKSVGRKVRAFFVLQDGRLHQKRADIELAKADTITEKKRAAANTRWKDHTPQPPVGPNGSSEASTKDAHALQSHSTSSPSGQHPHSISTAPAIHMECPVPVPKTKEVSNNILLFRKGSREETPVSGANSASQPEPMADPQAVAFEHGKAVGKIAHREYARGAYQPAAHVYRTAAEKFAARLNRPVRRDLSDDQLQVVRRAAGMIR